MAAKVLLWLLEHVPMFAKLIDLIRGWWSRRLTEDERRVLAAAGEDRSGNLIQVVCHDGDVSVIAGNRSVTAGLGPIEAAEVRQSVERLAGLRYAAILPGSDAYLQVYRLTAKGLKEARRREEV